MVTDLHYRPFKALALNFPSTKPIFILGPSFQRERQITPLGMQSIQAEIEANNERNVITLRSPPMKWSRYSVTNA